jgi:hypothetical protein
MVTASGRGKTVFHLHPIGEHLAGRAGEAPDILCILPVARIR